MTAPVEPKVKAGTLAATVAGVADWLLAKYLFPHMADPTAQALILAAVPGVLAFAGGWLAKHQTRAGAAAKPAPVAVAPAPPKAVP